MESSPTAPTRFFAKVRMSGTGDCWEWNAARNHAGYGVFGYRGHRTILAHRWSYLYANGELPAGLVLDHLCCNPRCVNPNHLEAVTQKENMRRWSAISKTHCKHGHEYTPENTYYTPGTGYRRCVICTKAASKRLVAKRQRERREAA